MWYDRCILVYPLARRGDAAICLTVCEQLYVITDQDMGGYGDDPNREILRDDLLDAPTRVD